MKKIKDMYNDDFCMSKIINDNRVPMNEWYEELINKTYNQLNLADVTRMIIQKIYLQLAVEKAINYIEENIFCGHRYEGELLELLSQLDKSYINMHIGIIMELLTKALNDNKTYDWISKDERNDFE